MVHPFPSHCTRLEVLWVNRQQVKIRGMTSQTPTFIHNHEYCSTFINLLWNYCVFQGCLAFQDQDTISLIPTYCSPKNSRVCSMIIIIHRPVKFRPWDLFLINALDLFGMRSNQLQPLFGHWKQSPVSFNHCWLTTVVEATKKKNWLSTISTVHQPTGFIHRTGCTGPTQLVVSSNSSKTKPAERKKICSVGVPSPHSRWEGCEGKADLQIKLILIHEICGKHLRN